jgi:hypothetical protein
MSREEFGLRQAQIYEQWQAKRREIRMHSQNEPDARKLVEEANAWHADQLGNLYADSGWTLEELGQWFVADVQRRMQRLSTATQDAKDVQLPSDGEGRLA